MKAKKSMFITTILMVAVLIVAVSTATFAWYTSATTLEATTAVVSSASSSSADIAIAYTTEATTTTIALEGEGAVLPMVPTDLIEVADESVSYTTSPMNLLNQFIANGDSATPWTSDTFYVINNNINNATNVTMSATFAAGAEGSDLSSHLCVAVFVNGKIAGVFAKGAYNYGTIVKDEGNEDLSLSNAEGDILIPGTETITISAIPAKVAGQKNYAEITVYAWIDGADLTSANANKQVAGFSFSFAAANA